IADGLHTAAREIIYIDAIGRVLRSGMPDIAVTIRVVPVVDADGHFAGYLDSGKQPLLVGGKALVPFVDNGDKFAHLLVYRLTVGGAQQIRHRRKPDLLPP